MSMKIVNDTIARIECDLVNGDLTHNDLRELIKHLQGMRK